MKAFKTILLGLAMALVMCLAAPSASAQVLRDANYKSIGRIAGNGIVRDARAKSVGSFDSDGSVRDRSGNKVGQIKRLEIFDASGERIGYINTDGTVRDGQSQVIGAVNLSDGKVTDASDRTLGYARGIRVDWIACYYLFNMFNALK